MNLDVGFKILIASPPDREALVAEIYHNGRFVVLISQERGAGLFDVETPGVGLNESMISRRVDLPGFIVALEAACGHLLSRKESQS
jgi:hypothetical protein